ncbi:MAG: dicarboxylate/amino acid:cation symporter [Bacteroidota bacterium]
MSTTLKIILALITGLCFGCLANYFGFQSFVSNWISPVGELFIRALQLVSIPLVIVSLVSGLASLEDSSKVSELGGRTLIAYLLTTVLAVFIGLLVVNVIQPGNWITEQTRLDLLTQYAVDQEVSLATTAPSLHFILDLIPKNYFAALTDNRNMLQVILVSFFTGIAILKITPSLRIQMTTIFKALNEIVMKMIGYIMWLAPLAVFALMADVMINVPNKDLLAALIIYTLTVLLGLGILLFLVYPFAVKYFNGIKYNTFLKGIFPAQLIAISTSSSVATLPVTMECVEKNFNVRKEVSSFVLPIAATVSMDATALYQAVAALFISQVFGIDLSVGAQLMVVVTATLASIGAAAVPSAGIIMLTIVLEQQGIPLEGLALILALDRPLDMLRTATNVTGDAAVATVIDKNSKQCE